MYNIYEKPWLLLIVAGVAYIVVLIFRALKPEKRSWRQWMIPLAIVVMAFAIDFLVKTDLEKINGLISSCIKASVKQKPDIIETFVASDYYDSLHQDKKEVMVYFRAILSEPAVKRFLILEQTNKISQSSASVLIKGYLFFGEKSRFYKEFKPAIALTLELGLKKYNNKKWQINQGEILEIDKQRIDWDDVQSLSLK
jgi:hypothetical protein